MGTPSGPHSVKKNQTAETRKDVEAVVAFAATHAFLLGLRTGSGLAQTGQ